MLFLGAGASRGAESSSKAQIPGTDNLRDSLADHFLGGRLKDKPLQQVVSFAIKEASLIGQVERIRPTTAMPIAATTSAAPCARVGVRHLRTKPYTPRTNGKAERFVQTVMRECAYARAFRSSQERAAALPRWLHVYNVHRPHTSRAGQPPISRLAMNNLLGDDT